MIYDITVIGGGPSGATAAEQLAKKGFKVALIDRAGRIKPCGCLLYTSDAADES